LISLESDQWHKLTHAYGSASDIPALLRQLAQNPGPKSGYKDEPWFSLWSALCHQEDVYGASYAALPHIVDIGINAQVPIDFSFFQLPACIEVSRNNGRGPEVPPELAEAYFDGLRGLHECAFRHSTEEWSSAMAQSVAAALAAAKGRFKLANALLNLDEDMITKVAELDL
jgi:hypothetical protein